MMKQVMCIVSSVRYKKGIGSSMIFDAKQIVIMTERQVSGSMMKIDEAIVLLKIKKECVNRNNKPFGMNCDRQCEKCDLLQNTDDLIDMYNNVIEWLEELKALRELKRKIDINSKHRLYRI